MAASIRTAFASLVLAALLTSCGAAIVPQVHGDADRMAVARRLYDKGEHAIVIEMLNSYTTTSGGSAEIDQAVYLLGLAYLGQKDWTNAQTQFERIVRDYPESDSAAAAAYHLGDALYGQSRDSDFDQEYTLKAMAQWQRVVADMSESPWAARSAERVADCRARLARKLWRSGDLYVKQNLYEPALVYFRSVITDYSDTPVLGDALIGLAVADARMGRKDTALVVLADVAKRYEGHELGLRAAQVRARVEKWPAQGDTKHQRHRSVESAQPTPQTASPGASTPFGS